MNYTISDIKVKEDFVHDKKLVNFFDKIKNKDINSKILNYIYLSLQKKKSDLYNKIKDISQIKPFLIQFDKKTDWTNFFANDDYSTLEVIDAFYLLTQKLFEFNKTKLVQESIKLKDILMSINKTNDF